MVASRYRRKMADLTINDKTYAKKSGEDNICLQFSLGKPLPVSAIQQESMNFCTREE